MQIEDQTSVAEIVALPPGSAVIEGVPPFNYRMGRDSFVLAARACAAALGREISYTALKGHSALAFRLIFDPDWKRFSPDALCGYDHSGLAFGALGLRGEFAQVGAGGLSQEESRSRISASIRAGMPVLAMHLMSYEDWGVIAGYAEESAATEVAADTGVSEAGGMRLICRTPHDAPAEAFSLAERWPGMLIFLREAGKPADTRILARKALRVAIEIFETPAYSKFASGRAALRCWIDGLRDQPFYLQYEEQGGKPYEAWIADLHALEADRYAADAPYKHPYLERAHVNAWRLESLIDARLGAAQYLEGELKAGRRAEALLLRAAQYYAAEGALLQSARAEAPWEFQLASEPWTQSKRERQAQILEEALDLEEQAIAEIRSVFAA